MSEKLADKIIFTLSEVLQSVQKTISARYTSSFWVKAEMNKLNFYKHSGHCYPELVEKTDGKIVAEIRAVLWNSDYLRINRKFQSVLKDSLKDGIKILFSARIQFDPKYGLSLMIQDIDPSFTLGDLEREKQETIQRLMTEGLFDKNKQIQVPLLPQRIAVISVETSKGYSDFLNIVDKNGWNYKFFHMLFPSLLQGDRAAASMINQLKRIKKVVNFFDVVAIIRGGGGEVGLTCYNDYELAKTICEFPIPVITGIGHSTNTTVSEMVAHTNAITPTKLGEWLLQKFHDFSVPVQKAEDVIKTVSENILSEQHFAFASLIRLFKSVSSNILVRHNNQLRDNSKNITQQVSFYVLQQKENLKNAKLQIHSSSSYLLEQSAEGLRSMRQSISLHSSFFVRQSKTALENVEKNVNNLHPDNVLKRGYSITRVKGKSISGIKNLKAGDVIETIIYDGNISSTVNTIKSKNEKL